MTAAKASAEEQAAVDTLLNEIESEPFRASPQLATDGHATANGLPPRSKRHLLLPVLHAIQERIGWISPGALNYASLRLGAPPAEVHGVASFYEMFSLTPQPPVVAHVCDDIACMARGAEALCAGFEKKLGPAGRPCAGGKAIWQRSSCLGLCERAPAALITVADKTPHERVLAPATVESVSSAITDAASGKLFGAIDTLNSKVSVPQAGQPDLKLLRRVGQVDPTSLD